MHHLLPTKPYDLMNLALIFSRAMAKFATFDPLHPENGKQRSCARLHIIDTTESTDHNISRNSMCGANFLAKLHEMMLEVNASTQKYKMMAKVDRTDNEFAKH